MFRQHNRQIEEKGAQVLGISCDHIPSHRAWSTALGGIPYPELSDWHPKGQVTQAYNLWNEERGAGKRAVIIIDKDGVIRHRKEYAPGTLPEPPEVLEMLDKLG